MPPSEKLRGRCPGTSKRRSSWACNTAHKIEDLKASEYWTRILYQNYIKKNICFDSSTIMHGWWTCSPTAKFLGKESMRSSEEFLNLLLSALGKYQTLGILYSREALVWRTMACRRLRGPIVGTSNSTNNLIVGSNQETSWSSESRK